MDERQQVVQALPHSEENERAVCGVLLRHPAAIEMAKTLVQRDMFYLARYRAVFKALLHLEETRAAVDHPTLVAALQAAGDWEGIGGHAFVAGLDAELPVPDLLADYCAVIRERWSRRCTLASLAIARDGLWNSLNSHEVIADLAANLSDIQADQSVSSGFTELGDLVRAYSPDDEAEAQGVTSGLTSLDDKTGGWRPGQLIVVAARPGQGKTSLALQMATAVAKAGSTVLLYELEMTRREICHQILSQETSVPRKDIEERRWLSTDQRERLSRFATGSQWMERILIDERRLSTDQISSTAALENLRHRVGLIVVDYLGLIPYRGRKHNTVHQLGELTKDLKTLAKRLDVPVVVLHHLSRKSEDDRRRPGNSDLRDSGEIEADADITVFPWRPIDLGFEDKDWSRLKIDTDSRETYAEVIIGKNRGGRVGKKEVVWIGESTQFRDLDDKYTPPPF